MHAGSNFGRRGVLQDGLAGNQASRQPRRAPAVGGAGGDTRRVKVLHQEVPCSMVPLGVIRVRRRWFVSEARRL